MNGPGICSQQNSCGGPCPSLSSLNHCHRGTCCWNGLARWISTALAVGHDDVDARGVRGIACVHGPEPANPIFRGDPATYEANGMNYIVRASLMTLGIALVIIVAVVLSTGIKPSIYYAVRDGDTKKVQKYLDGGGDVNRRIKFDKLGPTLLGIAAANGQVNTVELLLKNKANPDFAGNDFSFDPLVLAVDPHKSKDSDDSDLQITRLLLANGANPNVTNQQGNHCPALYDAAEFGRTEIVKLLLEAGADVNATNYFGQTPLHTVRNVESAKLLIAAGANCKALANGETPADVALREKRLGVYDILKTK
jgi:ankyrin repeat protein